MKCLTCAGLYKIFLARQASGSEPEDATIPEIQEAITFVPKWEQVQIGSNSILGVCSIPSCLDHIEVKEMSEFEKAMQGGRLLHGSAGLWQTLMTKP